MQTVEFTGVASLKFSVEPLNAGCGKLIGGALNVVLGACWLEGVMDLEAGWTGLKKVSKLA